MHPHYGFVGSTYVGNNVGIKQVQQIYGTNIHHQQVPFYSQHSSYSSLHHHQHPQPTGQQGQRNGHYSSYPHPNQLNGIELKPEKQLLTSGDLGSKIGWNSSAFLGPNLWDKDQLYSATGSTAGATVTPTATSTPNGSNSSSTLNLNGIHHEKSVSLTNNSSGNAQGNFKVENIDIDEFLCENNLNLNDIEQFSSNFDNVDQTRCQSPSTTNQHDQLILHSPMQAAPAKSPDDDSISHQSSSSSRKYSQDDSLPKNFHSKQMKKSRKSASMHANAAAAAAAAAAASKQFVPDEMKDEKYWARRRKNNLAAKRSRDARRMKENQIALRADFLERESDQLKKQVEDLKRENQKLKMKLIQYESQMK